MQGMIASMRWYGPSDVVPLAHIAQAGCAGVVTALHGFSPGVIWPYNAIEAHKNMIASHGMSWVVVESLPVHDHIKLGYADRDQLIEHYIISLQNLAKAGIKIITYNFMPLLDWVRTDVTRASPSGAEFLYFSLQDYAIFDLFILNRPGAAEDYTTEELEALKMAYANMSSQDKDALTSSMLMALPGNREGFSMDYLRQKLAEYQGISADRMRDNLVYFLECICPIADALDIKMVIHPDDPPFSVFGLPRIVSTAEDCRFLFTAVPNQSNGLCFCAGSFGSRRDNDLVAMLTEFGERVHFLHLRNTKIESNGDFYEADHLAGDANMYHILHAVKTISRQFNRSIPMRPDHGARILDDLQKCAYPGYTAIGRLKGLAELRGVSYAIDESMKGK